MTKRILVLGGDGIIGRYISRHIALMPTAECVIGCRHPPRTVTVEGGKLSAFRVDSRDPSSLRQACEGVFAVVNATGPLQAHDYTVPELCASLGIHYVDLDDSRAHVQGITRLNRRALQQNCQIMSGASAVPAVSTALVDLLVPEFDRISEIHASISIGNQTAFGEATLRTLLSHAGNSYRMKENGRWRNTYGWSQSEKVAFPNPIGRRRVYLCEVPELDIFPSRYGAQTVSFRAGMELRLFNHGLYVMAWLRRLGWLKSLTGLTRSLSISSRLFRGLGTAHGGMRVHVRGRKNGNELQHTIFLISRGTNGLVISCSPALALIRKWVERGVSTSGAVPCVGQLSWDEIKTEMVNHDIVLVRQ